MSTSHHKAVLDRTVELYRSGLSMKAVGERMDVSAAQVSNRLKEAGEPRRPRGRAQQETSGSASRDDTVLCLRSCAADMTSHGGFVWPREGTIDCHDWNPTPHCSNGLHGLLWGEGDGALLSFAEDAVWLVFEADAAAVVDLGGKVKVPSATVLFAGDRFSTVEWLAERAPGRAIVSGTATAGDSGTATAGDSGTATAGDSGTATAGDRGTATAGDSGTATAGDSGTATAGVKGVIAIQRWNGKRYRWTLGEIGETIDAAGTPLVADTPYRLDDAGKFVAVKE